MGYTDNQRQEHILELQNFLHTISIFNGAVPRIIPDGIYGPETANAVRVFQGKNSLEPTGEVSRATWDALVSLYRQLVLFPIPLTVFPNTPGFQLKPGDTGMTISLIQVLLAELANQFYNFPSVPVTGEYDASTSAAVRALRNSARLPEGDYVDLGAWQHLAGSAHPGGMG